MIVDVIKRIDEVYNLLAKNYVEGESFRFHYSKELLLWALLVPGYINEFFVGHEVDGELVGLITGVPIKLKVNGVVHRVVEINFLCVSKKYRGRGITNLLIEEITTHVKSQGFSSAVYTSSFFKTKPFCEIMYTHRPLCVKNLIKYNFMTLGERQTISRLNRLYKVNYVHSDGWRRFTKDDISGLKKLMVDKKVCKVFNDEEIEHYFINDNVKSFVIEKNGVITDFGSFVSLPSFVLGTNYQLKSAYGYYMFTNSLEEVVKNLIIEASGEYDVFTLLSNKLYDKFNWASGGMSYYCDLVNEVVDDISLVFI